MIYGNGGTIHQSKELDVETYNGKVIAVWFRCAMLPFEQAEVSKSRMEDMTGATHKLRGLVAVEFEDPKPVHTLSGELHRWQVTTDNGTGRHTVVTFEGADSAALAKSYLGRLQGA